MNRQSGVVLIAVMIALVLVAAIALMLNTEGAVEADRSGRGTEALQADYLAQAALQHALWRNESNACRGDFSVPSTSLGAHSYEATISGVGTTTVYSLSADQDAWTGSNGSVANYGSDTDLRIGLDEGVVNHALYRFDLSALPQGVQINSASASFFIKSGGHPEGPIAVHGVTADWAEDEVTWDNISSNFDSALVAMIPAQDQGGIRVGINLTAQVQAWVNGQPNYGILLATDTDQLAARYASREAAASERPILEVVVGTAPASPISVQATGTLVNGVTRTLSRALTPAYQSPSAAVLQLGTDPGEDAILDSFYSIRNFGGDDYVQVHDNGTDWQQYPLIRFDLAALPPNVAVRSARLEMNLQSLGTPGKATIHQVARSWVEGTKFGGGIADGATWSTYDGTNAWTSAGGDYIGSVIAETAINGTAGTWVGWEIAPLVERWLAGEPNYGLLIKPDSALKLAEFASREDIDATIRPMLTIEFACECGTACMLPQGAGDLLMVVINPTTLVPEDAEKKALFESWGYTVNVIGESANAATYASEAANNDVAFISETVNSLQVGDKLKDLSIGVVTQDGAFNSDLGFAGGSSWPVNPAISVTDGSHYITSVFPTGSLDIYTDGMEQLTVSGGTATGLQTLATTNGAGSLVALDASASLFGGGTAAGRRVMLPLGRDAGLNWDYLNNNGLLLVQRALAWASGLAGAGGGLNVLLVVGDPASLTPEQADKKVLMEGWGHTVSLVATSAPQAEIDAAAAAVDVVYVPELGSTPMNELGTKADDLTTAVITEEARRTIMLGSFALFPFVDTDSININDNSHYITETLPVGPVQLSTAVQSMWVLQGTLAMDLHVLGQLNGTAPGLAYLEEGELRNDSTPAPARRVKLPWGSYNFDINLLTDDGRTIMQRAIEWAGELGAEPPPPGYRDEFNASECDSSVDYAGSDGALDWSPWLWTEIDESDGSCAGQIQVATDPDIDDAGSFRLRVTGTTVRMRRMMDISSFAQPMLSFDYRLLNYPLDDGFARVRVSTDGGTNWTELARFEGPLDHAEYQSASYDLSGFIDTDTMIQFGFNGASQSRTAYFDNFHVQESSGGGDGGGGDGGGGGGGASYVEKHQPWTASRSNTWETVDLSAYGVPASAVVEVAVINSDTTKEHLGGVREVGSSLDRYLALHEAEGGGVDALTMHVQTDASSQIQHYSGKTGTVSFILLGYWTGAAYVEAFDVFSAGGSNNWQEHDLGTYGVLPNQVAEIIISNTSTSVDWLVGTRQAGSTLSRQIRLHETEGGGIDVVTMQVATDASSIAEVFAEADSVVDFYLLGHWSTPPGTYSETGGVQGQASDNNTWHEFDASVWGVPASSVLQIAISNEVSNFERELGIREIGSNRHRAILLQEAEAGGADTASFHVNVDANALFQIYSQDGTSDRYFYPLGWWVLN